MRVRRAVFTAVLLCLVLIGLDKTGLFSWPRVGASFILTPVQLGWYRITQGLGDQLGVIGDIGNLGQDNLKLRDQNDQLKAEIASLRTVQAENEALHAQIATPETSNYKMLSAQTLGFVPVVGTQELLLSAGSHDGVAVGQAVVSGKVILGRITNVTSDRSTVRLLTDPNSEVVVVTDKNAKGILVGQFSSSVRLTKILPDENLNIGDTVLTSGEGNWPKNFVAGEVTKVIKDAGNLFQEAEIRPLVSYEKLQTVFILLGQK